MSPYANDRAGSDSEQLRFRGVGCPSTDGDDGGYLDRAFDGLPSPPTAQLVRIPAPQAWLPQRTLSVSMVSASELRVSLRSQYGPSARTSSSSTGLRPVPPVRTDPVRIKYSPRGLRSRDHWFSSCVLWWAPDRAGDAQDWRRQRVGTAGGSAVSASRRASCCVVSF